MTVQITIGIMLVGMIVGSAIAASFISVSGEYGSLLATVAFWWLFPGHVHRHYYCSEFGYSTTTRQP